jgi:uncharacterized membrane protein YhiD involved in acid resistance
MESINNINYGSLADTAISLCAAFILGGLIGLERQYRQRTAGLRTNILVALGDNKIHVRRVLSTELIPSFTSQRFKGIPHLPCKL